MTTTAETRFVTIIILSYLGISHAIKEIELTRQFLDDLIRNEAKSTVLIIQTCWTRQEKAEFLKQSNEFVQFLNYASDTNLSASDISNKIWFLIKINCNGSADYLEKVVKHN